MRREPGTARIDDLLEHADWLRRLAGRLVRDVDDAVQDTWVAAMRSPPREERAVQPWLASVLRNLVRNRWRAGRTRAEAAAKLAVEVESTTPAADQLLERAQLQRVVAELVLELDEPYRSVILLRYYEGRDSSEIAEVLGVPAGTVRWRLKEGIERLRQRLDRRHGGERAAWVVVLAPLAGGQPAPALQAGGLMAMAVTTKSKVVAGVVIAVLLALLGSGGLWWLGRERAGTGAATGEMAARVARLVRPLTSDEVALPRAAIEGEVKDPSGRAVAGAVVVLSRTTIDGLTASRPAGLASSDGDGRFRFADVRAGEHLVSASAAGFAAALSPPFVLAANERKQVALVLAPGGHVLHGTVLDEGGGAIAGARVTAWAALSGGVLAPGPAKLLQTVADDQGNYRIGLAPREYTVRAEAAGYATKETTVAVTRTIRQDLRLDAAARVSGRVIERQTGQPVADAEVQMAPEGFRSGASHRALRTDGEGRFSFDDLIAGRYLMNVRQGILVGVGPVLDLVPTSRVEDLQVAMDRGVAIGGRVVDEAGNGVAGAQVTGAGVTASSHGDGSFRLEGTLPGRLRLRATAGRGDPWKAAETEVDVGPQGLKDVKIMLARGGAVAGRVVSADGRPAAGVYVRADSLEGPIRMGPLAAETGSEGRFRIEGLPDGKVSVIAWDPVGGVAREEVGPVTVTAAVTVELRLGPAASIAGTVKFDDGAPAPAVSVAFTGQERGLLYTSVATGDDGRFLARGLLPGRYTVVARRKSGPWNLSTSRERPELRIVTVGPEEQKDGVELLLRKGGKRLGGMVVFADGKPAVGTRVVTSVEENGRASRPTIGHLVEHAATVQEDGRFLIDDVEDGSFTLWAMRPGFADAQVEHVTAGRTDARLQLTAPAGLAGVVTGRDGRPVSAFSISVVPGKPAAGETPEQRVRRADAGGSTGRPVRDPAGAFEWTGLSAGIFEVKVRTPDGAGAIQTVTLGAGERKQGLRLVVDSAVTVLGKVVDLISGAPLGDRRVYARMAGRHHQTTTSPTGTFEVPGVLPGEELEVRVFSEREYIAESKRLTVPPGTGTVDLGLFRLMKGDFATKAAATGTFRMALEARDDRVTVMLVRPGSGADRAGIKVGDAIVAIDGRDVRGLGAGAVHHLLARNAGEAAALVVQSAGGEPRSARVVAERQ